MIVILKNLKKVFRTYNTSAIINLAGLSVALVAFMLILMQVSFEYGYDKFRPAHERIYRVETYSRWFSIWDGGSLSRPDAEQLMRLSPHIEAGGILYRDFPVKLRNGDAGGKTSDFRLRVAYVTPSFPETVQMEIVQGEGLTGDLSAVLIPQSMARRMFGDRDPVGQILTPVGEFRNPTSQAAFRICGVYRDIPGNSIIANNLLANVGDLEMDRPNYRNQSLFLRLDSPEAKQDVEELFHRTQTDKYGSAKIRLSLLSDVYFNADTDREIGGNRTVTRIFVLIAVLILGIAVINYFNFSVALVPLRIQSVNVQKVFGAQPGSLRAGLVVESVLYVVLAYLIAVWIILLLEASSLTGYLPTQVTLGDDPLILLWGLLIAAATGALAGLYPAFYATRIPPALALKGSFGRSPGGRRLRTLLVGFQYAVSIALIISALAMNRQYRLLRHIDLGFDRDQVVVLKGTEKLLEHREALSSVLRSNPEVREIAFAMGSLFDEMYSHWGLVAPDGRNLELDVLLVNSSFPGLIGARVYEGRDLTSGDDRAGGKPRMPVLANRTAQQTYGLKIGDVIEHIQIVGFIEDFHYKPLNTETGCFLLACWNPDSWLGPYIHLKVNSRDYRPLFDFIGKTVREFDPGCDPEPYLLDNRIAAQYRPDRQRIVLVTAFSLLAIVISLSGAFSLMVLETRYKRKEIGVRRVFGATVAEILGLFNRSLAVTVLVCFVVAVPVAWYGMTRWLEGYIVRTPLRWWLFALSLLVVLLVTVLTVTLQSLRAARANPVDSLKSE